MAKAQTSYICQSCGASHSKWAGKCTACGEWNTLVEEIPVSAGPNANRMKGGRKLTLTDLKSESPQPPRQKTAIKEFDRVCGGGLVAGSALLIGGDPGIGKSTLLLQIAAKLSRNQKIAYISGEEAIEQIRLRAERLGLAQADVQLAAATNIRDILATVDGMADLDLLVIDSIQTMYVDTLDSAPGTVAQVRTSAAELIHTAKKRGFTVMLVGHVTKEGTLAGPRVLEHMVDTVLYFEGERGHNFRILRAVKNRFGPANEIGVFEMCEEGLMEVENPSALFLSDRREDVTGTVVFAGMEGTRPVLAEIQALIAPSPLGTPRRTVVGWDSARLAMVIAVLETRCGLQLAGNDVYLNVTGGLKISEPAADLAVAAALVSSLMQIPIPPEAVVFGEIGLSGDVRRVGRSDLRLKEAAKLGFTQCLGPADLKANLKTDKGSKMAIASFPQAYDLISYLREQKHNQPSQPIGRSVA